MKYDNAHNSSTTFDEHKGGPDDHVWSLSLLNEKPAHKGVRLSAHKGVGLWERFHKTAVQGSHVS